jgi:hypothetical protein
MKRMRILKDKRYIKFVVKLFLLIVPLVIGIYCIYLLCVYIFGSFWVKLYVADTTIVSYNGPNPSAVLLFILIGFIYVDLYGSFLYVYVKEWMEKLNG